MTYLFNKRFHSIYMTNHVFFCCATISERLTSGYYWNNFSLLHMAFFMLECSFTMIFPCKFYSLLSQPGKLFGYTGRVFHTFPLIRTLTQRLLNLVVWPWWGPEFHNNFWGGSVALSLHENNYNNCALATQKFSTQPRFPYSRKYFFCMFYMVFNVFTDNYDSVLDPPANSKISTASLSPQFFFSSPHKIVWFFQKFRLKLRVTPSTSVIIFVSNISNILSLTPVSLW